jgi:hypothetical protein
MARPKTDSLRLKLHTEEIIKLYLNGYSKDELSVMFAVSSTLILRIVRDMGAVRTPAQEKEARLRQSRKESPEARARRGEAIRASRATRKLLDPSCNEQWVAKRKENNTKKYGVPHPMMVDSVAIKAATSWKSKCKEYVFSDGSRKRTAGYGTVALGLLEEQGYSSDDIETEVYRGVSYQNNGKMSRHIFDIFLPKQNRVIEVKSKSHPKFGFDADKERCLAKKGAAIAQGFIYEIWVIEKGELLYVV